MTTDPLPLREDIEQPNVIGPDGIIESEVLFKRAFHDLFRAMKIVADADPDYQGKLAFVFILASGTMRFVGSNLPDAVAEVVTRGAIEMMHNDDTKEDMPQEPMQ